MAFCRPGIIFATSSSKKLLLNKVPGPGEEVYEMDALIPAAGRGQRLDLPSTPKPLVVVDGKPVILRLMEQMLKVGISRVVVVLGYEAKALEPVLESGVPDGLEMVLLYCKQWEKGQAYSLLEAQALLPGQFVLAMADHVFDDEMLQAAASLGTTDGVTLLADPHTYQVFHLDTAVKLDTRAGRLLAVGRDLKKFNAVDTGLFMAGPSLFSYLDLVRKEKDDAELPDALELMALDEKASVVMLEKGRWDDLDTPADVVHAELRLRDKRRKGEGFFALDYEAEDERWKTNFEVPGAPPTPIEVGRGFVSNAKTANIIPPDSIGSPVFVFTDETVHELYGKSFVAALKACGLDATELVLPVGEQSKTLASYSYLVERVLGHGLDEQSVFISLGGGVVCNVCGFVASTIYRGMRLVHLPTTVMAQVDAAISHKQGINGRWGKNLIGTYFPPSLVACDIETLVSLPRELVVDGLSEVLKHGLVQDARYAQYLSEYDGDLMDLDFLETVVKRNVALKCELEKIDPKEKGPAYVLQYGHTVGHAVEHLSGYTLRHGEAISIGMMVAAQTAWLMGACSLKVVEFHENLLRKYSLPTSVPADMRAADILEALKYNKYYRTEGIRMALPKTMGHLWSVDGRYSIPVSTSVLTAALEARKEGCSKWNTPLSLERVAV